MEEFSAPMCITTRGFAEAIANVATSYFDLKKA